MNAESKGASAMSATRISKDDYPEAGARRRGHILVCRRVEEKTVIGGWTKVPIYRKGTPHITGWASAWSDRDAKERVFVVDAKNSEKQVHEIHLPLASGLGEAKK
jgi:hypothetical protein